MGRKKISSALESLITMSLSPRIIQILRVISPRIILTWKKKNFKIYRWKFFPIIIKVFKNCLTFSSLNLKDYVDERGEFVTAAMDIIPQLPYGSRICIPELNKHYNRPIEIQVISFSYNNTNKKNCMFCFFIFLKLL